MHRISKLWFVPLCLVLVLAGGKAHAVCSSSLGKVVINEYNYINNFIELKVLDPALTAGGANPFAGWKLAVWKKQGGGMTKANEQDVSSNYTDSAKNTCRATGNYTYVRIPFSAASMTNDEIVVLWETSGSKLVDLFRLGSSSLAAYPSSINAGYGNYSQCTTIENALPNSAYDAPLVGSAANKDIARLPDGTGPWTISQGTGAGSQQTLCTSNDGLLGITKTPSSSSVGVGSGSTFTWTINVQNGGTSGNLSNATVSDTMPANMYLSSCPASATCAGPSGAYTSFSKNVGTLAPGASSTITATAYVTAAGSYANTAQAAATELAPGYTQASGTVTASAPSLHHVRLNHTGSGVTCTSSSVTVNACDSADSGGTCTANTTGLSGNVIARSAGDATLATVPFTIASGSSSVTVTVPVVTAQTVTFETSGLSVAPSNAWTCWNGSAASCSHVYSDAGFIFDVPNHVAEVSRTVNVNAVRKSDNSPACTPAFSSVSKNVTFVCGYTNPATGTKPVRVGGKALNAANSAAAACDAGGHAVSLSFGPSGVASTTFQYADVGNMSLTATYTGSGSDAGLVMTGNDTFIAAPSAFAFSGITAGPIKAGNAFSATLTALNAAGNAAPNFGKESAAESATTNFTKCQPTGANAVNGTFSGSVGSFNSGAASATNLNWSEVGNGDLTATLASGSYLGSGLTATGNTGTGGTACNGAGNVGAFIPDHFNTAVTDGCTGCGFTYSGQPFTVVVAAMNGLATPTTTSNYDGTANTSPNFANNVTLSDANAVASPVGVLGVSASPMGVSAIAVIPATTPPSTTLVVPKTDFIQGVSMLTAVPTYTFNISPTTPTTIKIRAVDTVNASVTSSGFMEGTTETRSGRMKLSNAHGSELLNLTVPMEAQYWQGQYWAQNNLDDATVIVQGNVKLATISGSAATIIGIIKDASGKWRIVLQSAPGSSNVCLDLDVGATGDMTCVATMTPLSMPYLQTGAAFDKDPVSRATFGVYRGNNQFIYLREMY